MKIRIKGFGKKKFKVWKLSGSAVCINCFGMAVFLGKAYR